MDHSGHGMTMDLPPFTLGRGLEWSADPFFLVACLAGLALYGWGVVRLVRRGDKWPIGRTVAFVIGVLSIVLMMCTQLNDYGMVMFSVHMVQHMVISMVSPILILLGAPITLALRALPTAGRGHKGPRELLLMFLHSRYMRIITHPAFTIPLFIASLYGLYFTPLFDTLMGSKAGHIGMMVHFLAVGLVFFWPIMGVDPGPHRPGYLMRMLELFAGMPFHAFFGIALMMASEPMVETFKNPPASPGRSARSRPCWCWSPCCSSGTPRTSGRPGARTGPPTVTGTRNSRRTTPI
jgi:putative membrane protein/putative copper resistance protein D